MRRLVVSSLLALALARPAAADDDPSVGRAIAVQHAMSLAREHLRAGRAADAVSVLEGQLPRIDGNARYLALLRDAYVAHLKDLRLANRADEARVIEGRLRHLEPDAPAEPAAAPPETPAELPAEPVAVPAAETGGSRPPPATQEPGGSPPPPATEQPPPVKARAKVDDDPPADRRRADDLVARAEAAFSSNDFARAADLFDQAGRLDPASVGGCGERRGYCQLYRLVESVRAGGPLPRPREQLEAEVQEAVKLAPRLADYAATVLAHIKSAPAPAPAAAPPAGWSAADGACVRVLHQGNAELAARVVQAAEQARSAAYAKWIGQTPAAWSPRCDVYLHATGGDYARATGKPAASVGHATLQTNSSQVVGRRIDVHADDPSLLASTLPHEMTHVVLADLFPDDAPPRWADEGMAVLAESEENLRRYRATLGRLQTERKLPPVGQLVGSKDYPAPAAVTAFYVQSVSVVDYLVGLKGAPAFAMFVKYGPRYGWEKALERHYEIRGFADLQQRWERHAFAGGPVARGGP